MSLTKLTVHGSIAAAIGGVVSSSADATEYDNPSAGELPCVAMDSYDVERATDSDSNMLYKANVRLENLCKRAMELSFCMHCLEPLDDQERSCKTLTMRLMAKATVRQPAVPVRLAAPAIEWRYLE